MLIINTLITLLSSIVTVLSQSDLNSDSPSLISNISSSTVLNQTNTNNDTVANLLINPAQYLVLQFAATVLVKNIQVIF